MYTKRYEYCAEVIKVIDGDTLDLRIDMGMDLYLMQRIRSYGINAPDYKDGYDARNAAKTYLDLLLREGTPDGSYNTLLIRTLKDKKEKYGRYLANMWIYGQDPATDQTINLKMIEAGHAVEYMVDSSQLVRLDSQA